jgi:hypothetical protein
MISVVPLLTVRNLLIFSVLLVLVIILFSKREPREINNVNIQDLVEVGDFHAYYAKTTQWLNQINANIVEFKPNSIVAEHIDKTAQPDAGHRYFWHKKIIINFKQKADKYFINVEITPTSNYRDHIVEPYISWRNLVVEYYDFLDITLDNAQIMSIFSENYMRILLDKRRQSRNYYFITTVGFFALYIILAYRKMFRWSYVFLLGFTFIGLATAMSYSAYLDVKQKCNSLGIK